MSIAEVSPSNNWQNIGIMVQYAYDNIGSPSHRNIFIGIVRESFGYGNTKTLHKTQEFWADKFNVTKKTFNKIAHELEEKGHIKINHQKGYVVGGGSKAYSYSPSFPKHGNIFIKKNKDTEDDIKITEEVPW